MKKIVISLFLLLLCGSNYAGNNIPWKNGPLGVSENSRYLVHRNGTPFFWLGDTGWLMPERLNRDEVGYYLNRCGKAGYNVVQVQTVNGVPAYNIYGESSHPFGYDFTHIDRPGVYGYWDHMDYIVETAERNGIYIGMVCIWGGLVKSGQMTEEEAVQYGTFLANRYKDNPNIIWIIGGDIQGTVKTEVWETLARTIRAIDPGHLMTFHPRGRTCSSQFFPDAEWIDFHMFQSGHRRYGQRMGNKNYPIPDNTEEDSWRYVEQSLAIVPLKPVLDGEPSYENIPQGLHHNTEPRWNAADVRRYAYWSVFAGACGHTYGCNDIMQFYRPGYGPAYFADTPWWDALDFPGFNQMRHLKELMLTFPYEERVPDQTIIAAGDEQQAISDKLPVERVAQDQLPPEGTIVPADSAWVIKKYNRLVATRGADYLLVYNYTGRAMEVDLTRISGKEKQAWWYSPITGEYSYIGKFDNRVTRFTPVEEGIGKDIVLVVTDAEAGYLGTKQAVNVQAEKKSYEE
ncbi:MAG: glycoside hydrolase family 140 protein [Bacteroidaceae bacterium]|nr:glycoside hydrolase family 140 protein [Bacteroidaceae bacterium]